MVADSGLVPAVQASGTTGNQPDIPEIDVLDYTPKQLAVLVEETAEEIRWDVAFGVGEQVGRQLGGDLAKVAQVGAALPSDLGTVFFNGVGHSVEWNLDEISEEEARIVANIPETHRPSLFMGIIIRYALLHADDPDDVVAFAERFGAKHDVNPVDGVRIGVQRSAQTEPKDIVGLVVQYPQRYQKQLAEEIGWRIGSDFGVDPETVLPLSEVLALTLRPRFIHGLCRGAWTPGQSLLRMRPLLRALPKLEQMDCVHAIAFSMSDAASSRDSAGVFAELDDEELVKQLQDALGEYQSGCLGHLNPDLAGTVAGVPCGVPPEGSASQVPQAGGPGTVVPDVQTGEEHGTVQDQNENDFVAPSGNSIPCGDGVCDDAEQANARLCPRDCGVDLPTSGDWCGDGICDALEESMGDCSKDCS